MIARKHLHYGWLGGSGSPWAAACSTPQPSPIHTTRYITWAIPPYIKPLLRTVTETGSDPIHNMEICQAVGSTSANEGGMLGALSGKRRPMYGKPES